MSCPNENDPLYQHYKDLLGEETARAIWDDLQKEKSDDYDAGTMYSESGVNDSGPTSIDETLLSLYKQQIVSLVNRRRDLQGETDPAKRAEINARMSKIQTSIERLSTEITYTNIIKIATEDMDDAERLSKKANLSGKEVRFLGATLDRILLLNEAILNTLLSPEDLAKKNALNNRANILKSVWADANVKLIEAVSRDEGIDMTYKNLTAAVKDISYLKGQFLGIDITNIPILTLMDSMFETVKRKTRSIMFDFNKQFDKIKKLYSKKEDFRGLLENGRLITQTKAEYFDKERDMLQEVSYYLETHPGTKNRTLIYNRKDTWYLKNNDYTLTQEGIDAYESTLAALKDVYIDNETGKASVADNLYIDQWILKHSPYIGMNYVTSGKKVKGNSKWYQYLNSTPKAQWINPKYDQVKDTELYKFVTKTITDGMKMIPHSMMVDLNSFDRVFNSILFDFDNENKFVLRAAWEGVGDFMNDTFRRAISQEEIIGKSGKIVDEFGREQRKLYPTSITDLQTEKKFDNPLDLVKDFYSLAVAYNHKTEIEPSVWLLYQALDEQEKIRSSDSGIAINDIYATEKGGLVHAKQVAMANMMFELYGKKRMDVEDVEPTEIEKRESRLAHNKWDNDRKEALSKGLPFTTPAPVLYKFSGVKALDAVVDFTRVNLLWLKPISAITNLLVGLQNNFLHAGRRTDFGDSELFTAGRMLLDSTLKYISLGNVQTGMAKKINNMAVKRGITEESFIEDYSSYKSKLVAFGLSWQSSGEYIIANQIMIAKLLKEKIKNLAGEEKSLWEAFDEEGNFNETEFGEEDKIRTKKIEDRIREIRKQSQGDYQNVMQAKGKVGGRVLMLFRTWLPRTINNRFGEQVGDDFKGRYLTYRDVMQSYTEQNGILKGAGTMAARQLLATATKIANIPGLSQLGMKSLSELCDKKYEDELRSMGLSDIDIENMRVNVRELQYIVYIILIMMTLTALAGGGPPDKELTTSINLATRLYQDMTFFYSFNSATSITKDPIPIYKTIQDGYSLIGNAVNMIEDPSKDIYQRGRHEGESKTKVSAYKLLPGLSAYESTMNTMTQVFGQKPR